MNNGQMEFEISSSQKAMTNNLANAIKALRDGKVILLLDAHDRENEGDLVVAAERITEETMNFLIKKGSGVVCLALPKARLDELGLPLMISDNTNFFQTAFTVSIEAKLGVTTGVSAKDRAHTIQTAMKDFAHRDDLARPGHVFPLAARKNGIFDRMGHTEGAVDLMRMAGLKPGAVLCELMNEDGSMTVGEKRVEFAQRFGIPIVTIEEVLFYRTQTEVIANKSEVTRNTRFGNLSWKSFSFFDHIVVDVFHKNEEPKEKGVRIALSLGGDILKRFLANVLEQTEDDALVNGLSQVEQGKSDYAVMCTSKYGPHLKSQAELTALMHAAICRVLQELKVKEVNGCSIGHEIGRIASNYFSIALI